ncbi:MAG: hypothetical protein AAB558_00595 [Patescibacteria group bacterium]
MSRLKISFEDARRALGGGQEGALLRKLYLAAGGEESGQEGLAAILRGEQRITLVEALIKCADQHGRLIPPAGFQPQVVDAKRAFHLVQPALASEDYAVVLGRLQKYLPGLTFASAKDFQIRSLALVEVLRADQQAKNLLRGVHLPVTLPKITVADYGTTLEEVFLAAVGRSYQAQFPERKFLNHRKGTLAGQVTCVPESRQDKLLGKLVEGPVTGIYFPAVLQGFSIPAARAMVQMLPEGFILTGAMETATALTAYPETLARDYQTPGLDCAANVWQSPENSLIFKAFDDQLEFYSRFLYAYGYDSSGLLFLG